MAVADEIREHNRRFARSLVERDIDTLMDCYDPEVVMLIPGLAPVRGHAALRAYYQQVLTMGVKEVSMRTDLLEDCGACVVESGLSTMVLAPAGQPEARHVGKYLITYRRGRDGRLRYWHDMYAPDP